MTLLAAIFRFLRDRLEGLLFLLLTPLWLVGFLLGAWAALRGPGLDRGRTAQACRRWGRFVMQGLRPIRLVWWISLKLESKPDIVRHVLLLELFALGNLGRAAPFTGKPGKVLVVRLGHLGDILHTVPLAREWKRQRPGTMIDLLCGPWTLSLAEKFPVFDRAISYAPRLVQYNRGLPAGRLSMLAEWKFLRSLREAGYQAVVSTSPRELVDCLIEQALCPGLWLGPSGGPDFYPRISTRIEKPFDSRRPESEWAGSFLPLLGMEMGRADIEFPVSDAGRAQAAALMGVTSPSSKPGWVAVAPGAGWPGKCWEAGRFAELARRLRDQLGVSIVAIGSRDEVALASQIVAPLGDGGLNLAGRTTLDGAAAVLQSCRLLICNDSAALHIGTAVGVATVSLFGPTSPEKWAPKGEHHRMLRGGDGCPGCWYWHIRARCVDDRRCMRSIRIDDAFEAAAKLLAAI